MTTSNIDLKELSVKLRLGKVDILMQDELKNKKNRCDKRQIYNQFRQIIRPKNKKRDTLGCSPVSQQGMCLF